MCNAIYWLGFLSLQEGWARARARMNLPATRGHNSPRIGREFCLERYSNVLDMYHSVTS